MTDRPHGANIVARGQPSGGCQMNGLEWKSVLREHPLFFDLTKSEIDALLDTRVSAERIFAPGAIIIREGDVGDSLFVIGSGAVS